MECEKYLSLYKYIRKDMIVLIQINKLHNANFSENDAIQGLYNIKL